MEVPNFGREAQRTDSIPAFLLGHRRWRLIAALAGESEGKTAAELADESGAGQAWVYEVLRALKPLDALQQRPKYRYRMNKDDPLGGALIDLVRVLEPLADRTVDRPARSRPPAESR